MLRRRKLLEIAAESPASGARFVGLRAVVQDLLAVKEPACKTIDKIIAWNLDFDNNLKHKQEIALINVALRKDEKIILLCELLGI